MALLSAVVWLAGGLIQRQVIFRQIMTSVMQGFKSKTTREI
jgi:hypothetical protein